MLQWTQDGQRLLATAKKMHSDAIDALQHKDMPKCIALLEDALRLRRHCLCESDPMILATLDLSSAVCSMYGEKLKACGMLKELVRLKKLRLGPSHVDTEESMERLHTLLEGLGMTDDAADLSEEIWAIRCQSHRRGDFDAVLDNLAIDPLNGKWRGVAQSAETHYLVQPAPQRTSRLLEGNSWENALREKLGLPLLRSNDEDMPPVSSPTVSTVGLQSADVSAVPIGTDDDDDFVSMRGQLELPPSYSLNNTPRVSRMPSMMH